jgi:integrase
MARPRPKLFEVRFSPSPNGINHWRIVAFVNGVRKQYWHPTQEAAEADAQERNAELAAFGSQLAISAVERARWQGLLERLAPFGTDATPEKAIEFYIDHLSRIYHTVPFSTLSQKVRAEFKRRFEANEVSDRHRETMHETLGKMESAFGNQAVNSITSQEVRTWLVSLELAAKTRNKYRGYAGQVFSLAKDWGFCQENPVTTVKPFRERVSAENGKINILSPEDTAKFLHACTPEIAAFQALLYFAGIRRSTLEALDWSEINLAERRITVPGYKGKNQQRYHVAISDNLLEWIKPYARETGPLLCLNPQTAAPSERRMRRLEAEAAERAGIKVPDNAGRHSFISYHVAFHQSMDRTALEANNSTQVIKDDYLHLVTKEQAACYWKIRPRRSKP